MLKKDLSQLRDMFFLYQLQHFFSGMAQNFVQE